VSISILAGLYVFHVPMRGSYVLLVATSFLFLFGSLLWGIFISATARTQAVAFQLGALTSFLPAMQLSGFIYAVENMPTPIRILTYIVPARYFVTIVKSIFLKGVGAASRKRIKNKSASSNRNKPLRLRKGV